MLYSLRCIAIKLGYSHGPPFMRPMWYWRQAACSSVSSKSFSTLNSTALALLKRVGRHSTVARPIRESRRCFPELSATLSLIPLLLA